LLRHDAGPFASSRPAVTLCAQTNRHATESAMPSTTLPRPCLASLGFFPLLAPALLLHA